MFKVVQLRFAISLVTTCERLVDGMDSYGFCLCCSGSFEVCGRERRRRTKIQDVVQCVKPKRLPVPVKSISSQSQKSQQKKFSGLWGVIVASIQNFDISIFRPTYEPLTSSHHIIHYRCLFTGNQHQPSNDKHILPIPCQTTPITESWKPHQSRKPHLVSRTSTWICYW